MTTTSRIRCYGELRQTHNFEERFKYLRLHAEIGVQTFGFDRYLNQQFYRSKEWRDVRRHVIARDNGCDLGIEGYDVYDRIVIHHMNPMTVDEVTSGSAMTIDPEFLITVSHRTHNAIHYGDENLLVKPLIARRPGDTKLW